MAKNGKEEGFEGFNEDLDDELYTELNDARREELDPMVGLKVLGIELWDESLGDDEDEDPIDPSERTFFDCDLFLDEEQALELYVTSAYPDPDGEAIKGMDAIFELVGKLSDDKMELLDFDQADEEGGLAVAFGHGEDVKMILVASAWMVAEWEPDAEDEDEDEEEEQA